MNLIEQIRVNDVSIDGYQGTYQTESPEWVRVIVDSEDKVLAGIKADGTVEWSVGVPTPVRDYVEKQVLPSIEEQLESKVDKEENKSLIDSSIAESISLIESPEYIQVTTDSEDKIVMGIKENGAVYIPILENDSIDLKVDDAIERIDAIDASVNEKMSEIGAVADYFSEIEDPEERSEVTTDVEGKIISYRNADGTLIENVGIETNSLNLTNQGMTDFQKALKDSGFDPGTGDWSDYISNDGDNPLILPEPKCAKLNIISSADLTQLSKAGRWDGIIGVNCNIPILVEFWDMQGNYFKKPALLSGQGNSSLAFIKKNLAIDLFDEEVDGDAFAVKFGNWVSQDSFHLKGYYNDAFRCVGALAYDIYKEVLDTRGIQKNAPYKLLASEGTETDWQGHDGCVGGNSDFDDTYDYEARCMPAGFPCVVYQNGEFFGIYSWQIKKNRKNYHQKKDESKHIHLDGTLSSGTFFNTANVDWTQFEVRNPKYLVYAAPHTHKVTGEDTYEYEADLVGQYEIAGLVGDEEATPWTSDGVFAKGDIVSRSSRLYLSKINDNIGHDPSAASYGKKPKDVYKKSNAYWIEITFTNDVKRRILRLSNYMSDIREAAGTMTTEELREFISNMFFTDFLVDYIVCVNALYDIDSVAKNWQWTTWDGIKWLPNLYDCDVSWGNGVGGNELYPPSNEYVGRTGSLNLPTQAIIENFTPEIEARYKVLRDSGIISSENFIKKVQDWMLRLGKDSYSLEYAKWTDCPCNRSSGLNEEYWKVVSVWAAGTPNYDPERNYAIGDTCIFGETGNYYQYRFECVKACQGEAPCTIQYQYSPKYLGRYDSIYRLASWIEKRLSYIDEIFNYSV